MSQLDLPPISFARYLDLLKRRKWLVVPVSLLGMIIGALIAASVPRFYVASTDVHFNAEHLLSAEARGLVDPLEELLSSARPLIEAQVPEVLRQLGWQEALVDDADERAQFVAEVTSRVTVTDLGTERRNRVHTNLRITYRDTDGKRAGDFANALRDHWISKQLSDLERVGNAQVQIVLERRRQAQEQVDGMVREITRFQSVHKIDPALSGDNLLTVERSRQAQLQEDRRRQEQLQLDLEKLNSEIASLRQQLEGQIQPLIPAPPPAIDPVLALELQELRLQIRGHALKLKWVYNEGTPEHETISKLLASLQEELKAKTPIVERQLVSNPEYLTLQRRLDTLDGERRALEGTIDTLGKRIAKTETELAGLPPLMQEYNEKLEARNRVYQRLAQVEADFNRVSEAALQVRSSKPFDVLREAKRPPRPTEPNIAVLAIIGSLFGLGIAVGLIFAFDVLRFTYKTIDELERGLQVPVLGGVSHVETQIERSQTRRGRFMVSGLAMLLVFLIVAVATLYYVAPARLPVWARDVLDVVLGSDK